MNSISRTSEGLASVPRSSADGAPAERLASRVPARLSAVVGALVALVLLVVLGLSDLTRPVPVSASASPAVFSAGRAMVKLGHIAAVPHAVGTVQNEQVRNYLIGELKSLGLAPQVQTAFAVSHQGASAGYANNILVRIPGRAHGKALMLAAHYDSVPTGFGAADDGASVAAILETLRALATAGPLKNDVIVLFSDGEEAGLFGAEAFAASHPWAKDVGVALNFEYRGNSGPILMFETSAGNGKLVQALAGMPNPVGNSLMYEIYKMLPNDTDMSVFKRSGMAGMNFAAMERPTSYHSQLDRPDLLDQGSLQQQGDMMLALTRHFGNADLNDIHARDRVYFDVPGLGLVSYSTTLVLPLACLAVVLFGLALRAGLKSGAVVASRAMLAALLLPLAGVVLAVALTVAWMGICAIHPQYQGLMDAYNAHWYWLAFVALATGLFATLQARLQRRFKAAELGLGAALFWLLLLLASALVLPGASFIFTWPLIPVLGAQVYLLSKAGAKLGGDASLIVMLLAAAPAVILFAPMLRLLFIALTTGTSGPAIFLLVLLLGILSPLLAVLHRRFIFPALPLLVGLASLLIGSFTAPVSQDQPQPDNLTYVQNGMTGTASWLSSDENPDAWLKSVLGANASWRLAPELFGAQSLLYWTAPAPALGVQAPAIEVTHDEINGDTRRVNLRVRSLRAAPEMKIYVDGVSVQVATVQGVSVLKTPRSDWSMVLFGLPAEGVDVSLEMTANKPFLFRAIDRSYGLPSIVAPRGADRIAQPNGMSDSVRAFRSLAL
jgi:hypothetical protein